jgi:hypothetical protein
MDDLLDFVLEAHGALRRWPGVSALTAKLAVGWPFWRSIGSPAIRRPGRGHLHPSRARRPYPVLAHLSRCPGLRDQPVGGRWPAWGRPLATFPTVIATCTAEQVFYFSEDGVLRRLDYTVGAGALAAHYAGGYKTFGGLASPSATGSTAAALTLRRRRCAVSPVVPTGLDPLTERLTVKHHHHCSRQPLMTGY